MMKKLALTLLAVLAFTFTANAKPNCPNYLEALLAKADFQEIVEISVDDSYSYCLVKGPTPNKEITFYFDPGIDDLESRYMKKPNIGLGLYEIEDAFFLMAYVYSNNTVQENTKIFLDFEGHLFPFKTSKFETNFYQNKPYSMASTLPDDETVMTLADILFETSLEDEMPSVKFHIGDEETITLTDKQKRAWARTYLFYLSPGYFKEIIK